MGDTGRHSLTGLWRERFLVDGRICIARARPVQSTSREATEWLTSAGRAWRRLPRAAQWISSVVVFVWLQSLAAPAGFLFALLMVGFLVATSPAATTEPRLRKPTPEAALAATRSIEAQVAGAACRAWDETVREPSWSSAALSVTRASFDGQGEVDAVIDLALRISAARRTLGKRPAGPAGDFWLQQWNALDRAAVRLGDRADALIRHRDQAAALSAELAQLAELERLERSSLLVDDLTIETSAAPVHAGLGSVSEQIAATRLAVHDLITMMTRTRAPLAEPLPPPPLH